MNNWNRFKASVGNPPKGKKSGGGGGGECPLLGLDRIYRFKQEGYEVLLVRGLNRVSLSS